jgi:hypothetical protein
MPKADFNVELRAIVDHYAKNFVWWLLCFGGTNTFT